MDRINIAIALDRNVLYPAYVMIRSLAKNNSKHPICVYVLHSKLTEADFNLLRDALMRDMNSENCMEFIRIDAEKVSGLLHTEFWTMEIYYRLMLPELLGGQIERILYLDVDIIVNKDIWDFYQTDFEEKLLIVGRDMISDPLFDMDEEIIATEKPELSGWYAFFKKYAEKGMTYFCSGVLLMNLLKLKEEYSFQKYLEIYDSISDKLIYPDQDLLNYAHYNQVKLAEEKKFGLFAYPAHEMGMSYKDVYSNVSIIHFAGAKPWTINMIRFDIEKIWWEYAKDSPFYHELLETIFYQTMESRLAEEKLKELLKENDELRELLNKCQAIIQKFSSAT